MTTIADVIEDAQTESGITLGEVTSTPVLRDHLLRYRQRLIGKLASVHKDVTDDIVEVAVPVDAMDRGGWGTTWNDAWGGTSPTDGLYGSGWGVGWGGGPTGGWGLSWGLRWGAVVPPAVDDVVAILVPGLQAIWEVTAHHIATDTWPIVSAESISDAADLTGPSLTLRDEVLRLLRFGQDWNRQYDAIRLYGVLVPPAPAAVADTDDISPSTMLETSFTRCMVLEGARFLYLLQENLSDAGQMAADLAIALNTMLRLADSYNVTKESRQCQRP